MDVRPEQGDLSGSDTLKGIERADGVSLPLPAAGGAGRLNAPLSDRKVPLAAVVQAMRPGQILCGRSVNPIFILCIQSIRRNKMCICTTDFYCFSVHQIGKCFNASTNIFSYCNSTVVMTFKHQRIKQIF